MKKKFVFLSIVLMLVVALFPAPVFATDPSLCPERTLSASGNGEIKVTPDIAKISAGVMTENRDVREAQTENAKIMDSLIKSLTDSGIAREDIQTSGYSIYPVYDDTSPFGQKIRYYQVVNSVQITIRDSAVRGKLSTLLLQTAPTRYNPSVSCSLKKKSGHCGQKPSPWQ